jgi:hypothetical protein
MPKIIPDHIRARRLIGVREGEHLPQAVVDAVATEVSLRTTNSPASVVEGRPLAGVLQDLARLPIDAQRPG